MNPLLKERLNIADVKSALQHIHSETERVLDSIEKHEKSGSGDSEMNFVMAMSGLELNMTNLCNDFRESFL